MSKGSDSRGSGFWHLIQGRLILLLLTVLVPILLVQAYVYRDWLGDHRAEELQDNLEIAHATAKSFETFLHSLINSQSVIGQAFTSFQQITDSDRKRIFDRFQAENPEVQNIFWINPGGSIVASSLGTSIGLDVSDRSYYRHIISGKDWAVSELLIGKATGRPTFVVSKGIRDEKGELSGIVAASINPDRLDDVLEMKRSEGGAVSIVDKNGMLVCRYPSVSPTWEERNWIRDYPEYKEVLQGKEVSKSVYSLFEGKNRLIGIVPIPSIGWAAGAARSEEIVMQPIVSQLFHHATLFFAIALGSFGAALLISRRLSSSVKQLRDKIIALGYEGTHDPVVASGPAELRELAGSFNEMADKLRSRELRLRHSNRTLRALSNTIQATVQAVDESDLFGAVCRIIVEDCGHQMVWIGLAEDDKNQTVRPVAQAGAEKGYLETIKITWSDTELGRGPTGTAIRTGTPDACANMLTEPRMQPWREQAIKRGYASSVALPLIAGGRTLGALTIYSKEPDSFPADEVKLLAELADDLAYGIDALRLRIAHQQSEKKLREGQARLDLALRSAGMGTWHWDIEENKRSFDDRACYLLGIDPVTYTGEAEGFFAVLHPDDRDTVKRALARTLEKNVPYEAEYRTVRPDGSVHCIAARGKLLHDDEGKPVRINGLVWDISETKRMEEELRKSRNDLDMQVQERTTELSEYIQRLKLATEVARMGVWELDVKKEKIVWDDRIFDILGVPSSESITFDHWNAIICPDDVPNIEQRFWKEICESGHGDFECRIIRPSDGATRHIQCAASAIFNDKKEMVKVIGIYFDITEQKRVEEELRAIPSRLIAVQEEERRRLASELHDSIGQTLAALKFRIEHVIVTLERYEPVKALHLLHEFVPILQGSIDETRAIYMGLKPMILADHGILATLEWYRQELLKLYPNLHVELDTTIREEDIPEDLKTAIFRIVQEALNNSFKHGKSEWVDVRLTGNYGTVELEISDDGVGMDMDYVMESCTSRSLGLVGMRERTEFTGGEFTIISAPNEGATVRAVWRNRLKTPH